VLHNQFFKELTDLSNDENQIEKFK